MNGEKANRSRKGLVSKVVSMVTRSLADYVTARAVWICSFKMNMRVKPPELST